jgi:hypothetical protein
VETDGREGVKLNWVNKLEAWLLLCALLLMEVIAAGLGVSALYFLRTPTARCKSWDKGREGLLIQSRVEEINTASRYLRISPCLGVAIMRVSSQKGEAPPRM